MGPCLAKDQLYYKLGFGTRFYTKTKEFCGSRVATAKGEGAPLCLPALDFAFVSAILSSGVREKYRNISAIMTGKKRRKSSTSSEERRANRTAEERRDAAYRVSRLIDGGMSTDSKAEPRHSAAESDAESTPAPGLRPRRHQHLPAEEEEQVRARLRKMKVGGQGDIRRYLAESSWGRSTPPSSGGSSATTTAKAPPSRAERQGCGDGDKSKSTSDSAADLALPSLDERQGPGGAGSGTHPVPPSLDERQDKEGMEKEKNKDKADDGFHVVESLAAKRRRRREANTRMKKEEEALLRKFSSRQAIVGRPSSTGPGRPTSTP